MGFLSLKENMTMSGDIAFLPGGFSTVKSSLLSLAKLKKQWNIRVLEDGDLYNVLFEDALKVVVNKEDWKDFISLVPIYIGSRSLNLAFLMEGVAMKELYELLLGVDCKIPQEKHDVPGEEAISEVGKDESRGSLNVCQDCGKEYTDAFMEAHTSGGYRRTCPECGGDLKRVSSEKSVESSEKVQDLKRALRERIKDSLSRRRCTRRTSDQMAESRRSRGSSSSKIHELRARLEERRQSILRKGNGSGRDLLERLRERVCGLRLPKE